MVIFRSIALLCVLVLGAPAFAADGPAIAARAQQAAAGLQAYHDSVLRAGKRPDYTTAPAAGLLRGVFDAEALAALPLPTSGDVAWLMEWSAAANAANRQIMLFGMQPGAAPDEALMKRNIDDYEDQVTVAMDVIVRLSARALDAMVLYLGELPKEQVTHVRLEGFQMARSGGGNVLQGVLISAAHAQRPANARVLMAAVDDTRDTWVSAVLPDDRARIVGLLKQMPRAVSDREVTRQADVLLAAFTAKAQ